MNDKSHVSLEAAVCPVCGNKHQTGNILIHKRLAQALDRETVTGWDFCGECQKMLDTGYIALVECKAKPTWMRSEMRLEDAQRTGKIAWLVREVFRQVFGQPDTRIDDAGNERKLPLVFVEEGVIDRLNAAANAQ